MASTSELWAIAQAQARNPMAEGATTALQGLYGGYNKAKLEDRQMIEDKWKELERIRQIMAWKQMDAQMTEERNTVLDQIGSGAKPNTNEAKTMSLIEGLKFGGEKLTPEQKKFNASIDNTPAVTKLPGKQKFTINKDGMSVSIGEDDSDIDTEYKKSQIEANKALANKRKVDATNVGKQGRGGAGADQKKIVGDLIDKALKIELKGKESLMYGDPKAAEFDTRISKLKKASDLVVAGDIQGGQKILKEIESEAEGEPDEKVMVINSNGQRGHIPKKQLSAALEQGYKEVK